MKNAQSSKVAQPQTVKLSLYVNGRYCESDAGNMPYMKDAVIMLSLRQVCTELGLNVTHDEELGYYLIFARSQFDADALTIRYLRKKDGKLRLCFYMQRGELLDLEGVAWNGEELFVPMELFTRSFGCSCTASDRGNINVRKDETAKPAGVKPPLILEAVS